MQKREVVSFTKWFGGAILLVTIGITLITANPVRSDDAGFALSFNGSTNYVELGGTENVFPGTGWATDKTISVWIRPDSLNSPSVDPTTG